MNQTNKTTRGLIKATAIQWVQGVPEPVYRNITPKSVKELATTALSMPYVGVYDEELGMHVIEPEFEGMSNAEVMWVKVARKAADGELEATKIILDRVLGKPKQSIESTTMSLTYPEFLEMLSKGGECQK